MLIQASIHFPRFASTLFPIPYLSAYLLLLYLGYESKADRIERSWTHLLLNDTLKLRSYPATACLSIWFVSPLAAYQNSYRPAQTEMGALPNIMIIDSLYRMAKMPSLMRKWQLELLKVEDTNCRPFVSYWTSKKFWMLKIPEISTTQFIKLFRFPRVTQTLLISKFCTIQFSTRGSPQPGVY